MTGTERRPVPWRGRRRVDDPREKWTHVRWTAAEHGQLIERAEAAGLSLGAYLRAVALGSAGVRAVKRPPVNRVMLARLLGEIGHIGGNINQLALNSNRGRTSESDELSQAVADIAAMREAVMKALGRGD